MRTVYTIAFSGDRFLMVWHPQRKGWEMPGGHIEDNETIEDAARREFIEESGYSIEIASSWDYGYCDVCAGLLKEKQTNECEMRSELFYSLPDELSFEREEYEETITEAMRRLSIPIHDI